MKTFSVTVIAAMAVHDSKINHGVMSSMIDDDLTIVQDDSPQTIEQNDDFVDPTSHSMVRFFWRTSTLWGPYFY